MKFFLLILLILSIGSYYAADLTVENVGDRALITLRIDSQELFDKNKVIDYNAIFEVFNNDDKVVHLSKHNIKLTSGDIEDYQRVIYFLETELTKGEYIAFLKLNNNLRNDRKEEKFEFSVEKNQHFSNLYLVKDMGNSKIEIVSWDEIKVYSNVFLYQIFDQKVETLNFVSENTERRIVTNFETTNKLFEKLESDYLVDDFTNNYIEFAIDDKLYQQELIIKKYLNSFQKKYSWDDQLNQIKYIVNDRTWKEINRDPKMTTSQKVLRFWEQNNLSNSPDSELQDVFYNRILHADRKFSVHRYKRGWQTDRGRIYIKFGQPDEIGVDNNPVGKYPTQTWFYYRLNKTFLFYDRSRIEDYKLYNKEEEYDY